MLASCSSHLDEIIVAWNGRVTGKIQVLEFVIDWICGCEKGEVAIFSLGNCRDDCKLNEWCPHFRIENRKCPS